MTLQIDATGGCTHAFNTGKDYGISDYYCIIRESKYQKNLIPVSFNLIKFFELNDDLSTNGAATVIKGRSNGEKFDLVLNNYASTETPSGGVQFMLQGINSDGNTVTQDYIISFTNNCSSLVFSKGDRIGFLKVVSMITFLDEKETLENWERVIHNILLTKDVSFYFTLSTQTAVNQPSEGMCPAAVVQRANSSPTLVYTMSDDSITEASGTVHLSDSWGGYQKSDTFFRSYSYDYWKSASYNYRRHYRSSSYSYSHSYKIVTKIIKKNKGEPKKGGSKVGKANSMSYKMGSTKSKDKKSDSKVKTVSKESKVNLISIQGW